MDSNSSKEQNLMYYPSSDFEEENKILKETIIHLRNEIERLRAPPLMVCELKEVINEKNAIIKIPNGNQFFVNISNNVKDLASGDNVLVDQKNLNVVKKLDKNKYFPVEQFIIIEKPEITFNDVGGLENQIKEIKEVVELPLKKPELFKKLGIQPPKGILLFGEPGTGKTLLAKAVANSTKSTFIEVVASELVQKFIGEGAKLVKEIFDLAKEKSPSIIFIDEIDALASIRVDIGTSGEREVQRTFMQLLAEIDGFSPLKDVKIIGCTNRRDILDPAITRPGRLDRLIYVPLPNKEGVKQIFNIHTKKMKLVNVNVEKILNMLLGFSGAEIKAVCTEAGYFAIREDRTFVNEKDFLNSIKKIKNEEKNEDFVNIFG
ncbi:MAG: AAA family ATPase [Candidatus Woesearchaeota archaeon]